MDDREASADHTPLPATTPAEQDASAGPADMSATPRDRAAATADNAVEPPDPTTPNATAKRRSFLRELPFLVGIALVVALLLKVFLIQTFYIPTSSMEDTLHIDDRVLVNKAIYHLRDIKRGEIVVFNGADSFDERRSAAQPHSMAGAALAGVASFLGADGGERDYIKRVIGLPGDRVKCCDDQGRLTVNGVALDEGAYLYPGDRPSLETFDVVVPEGRLWVMGDHRTVSQDSRSHLGEPGGGTVPVDKVVGKAFVVVWPLGHWRLLPIPDTFKQPAIDANAGRG